MYWKAIILIIFAIFCGWTYIECKIRARKEDEIEAAFWKRENEANSVRRKPIDHLDYIKLPDTLPVDLLQDNIEIQGILTVLDNLKNSKILNLTGYTNTDLKLKYGAPNITELSQYDQNYTTLVTTFQKWADILLEADYTDEAVSLMEFLVSTKADIGKTYRLLANHYLENGMNDKYEELLKSAGELKSLNTQYIYKSIKDLKNE